MNDVSKLLERVHRGEPSAAEGLLPLVYDELRKLAAVRLANEAPGNTLDATALLGGALLGQKKYADAEPLLVKGYEGMKAREKTIPKAGKVRLIEAAERLVQLYEATVNAAGAERWRRELAERRAAETAVKK
jgi:hypothetical protein